MAPLPMMELFAGELRRLRTANCLSQEALAEKINFSPSLVAAVEQCRRPPRLEFTEQCDAALGGDGLLLRIREAGLHDALVPWFREWAAVEHEARALRTYQPLVVPGLFQTSAYMRALCHGGGPQAEDEIEQTIAGRLARQEILERPRPPLIVALVDYTAVERPIGGPETMREQLHHLIGLAGRPNVHLHVIPEGVGAYPGLSGPFVLASPPEGNDVAYLDNPIKGTIVDRAAEIRFLQEAWEAVRAEALPQRQTLALISEVAARWN